MFLFFCVLLNSITARRAVESLTSLLPQPSMFVLGDDPHQNIHRPTNIFTQKSHGGECTGKPHSSRRLGYRSPSAWRVGTPRSPCPGVCCTRRAKREVLSSRWRPQVCLSLGRWRFRASPCSETLLACCSSVTCLAKIYVSIVIRNTSRFIHRIVDRSRTKRNALPC